MWVTFDAVGIVTDDNFVDIGRFVLTDAVCR